MQELQGRSVKYNLIDTGQHAAITLNITKQFSLDGPNIRLGKQQDNINTLYQAALWIIKLTWKLIFKKEKIFKDVFQEQKGICLIHGDTLSTLVALSYAKRCGLTVAHVEAGLRSYKLFDPFPEELVRLIAMRFSDILFAPSDWAYSNLLKMGYGEKAVNIQANTIIDAVRYAQSIKTGIEIPEEPYILVTTHRVETIFSKTRLTFIIDLLTEISDKYWILFVLHDPTIKKLEQSGLMKTVIENPKIKTLSIQPYLHFLALIQHAEFVITDGGSIQEETAFLNVPCIILRESTERLDGLSSNALLSGFDRKCINQFLTRVSEKRQEDSLVLARPSAKIVDFLEKNTNG